MLKMDNKVKIKSNGKYTISYNDIEFSFKGGATYTIDEDTAKMCVENGYATYIEVEDGTNKSKKTNKDKK